MLAAGSNMVAFLIQNVAIAHPKDAEGSLVANSNWSESEWS